MPLSNPVSSARVYKYTKSNVPGWLFVYFGFGEKGQPCKGEMVGEGFISAEPGPLIHLPVGYSEHHFAIFPVKTCDQALRYK